MLTPENVEFIAKNASLISDKEGAKQLSAIIGKEIKEQVWTKARQKLGLRKTRGKHAKVIQNEGGQSGASPTVATPVQVPETTNEAGVAGLEQEKTHERF